MTPYLCYTHAQAILYAGARIISLLSLHDGGLVRSESRKRC